MNKPVSLELSILSLSKISIHEFWYEYVKPRYSEKVTLWLDVILLAFMLCYFLVHIKADDIYKDIEEDVEIRFYTSN